MRKAGEKIEWKKKMGAFHFFTSVAIIDSSLVRFHLLTKETCVETSVDYRGTR
jgi:hypothetical protein